ncbi:hypothetical protein [Phenylobacterium sp.]|uniref:hypothetical protein n=1 Tax=Phenylobacterium sp. TaxID=1871053 RepID=UPI003D2B71E0
MRAFLVAVSALAFATAPLAAERLPRFREETPYPTVRAQLIRMGYTPQIVRTRPGAHVNCWPEDLMCRTFPEIVSCTGGGALFCLMLFKRRSDGRLFLVTTGGEPLDYKTPPDFSTVGYILLSPATSNDLRDVVIANDARKGRPQSR